MAKNPFTAFKSAYAGKPTVADKLSEEARREMLAIYEATYNKIYKELDKARKEVDYATYARQTQLLKQLGAEIDGMKGKMSKKLSKALAQVAKFSTKVAIKDLELIGGTVTKAETWHYKFNGEYAKQTFEDNYEHIAAQTDRMKTEMKMLLRTEAMKVSRRAAVEGMSRRDAYKALKDEILSKDPEFKFVDKTGRRWDTANYFDMLTKTLMASTLNECYTNSLVNEGQDLVKVSVRGATDACAKWEGKILSLSGATKGYPTVEDAKATKEVFHPRCRHRLFAYHADIEKVFEDVEKGKTREETIGPEPKGLEELAQVSSKAKVRDDIIKDREKLILDEYFAGDKERYDIVTARFKDTIANAHVLIRRKNAERILDSGRFKTQFETNTSSGMLSTSARTQAEMALFDYPEDLDPKQRPVYGYLSSDEFGNKNEPRVSGYGNMAFRLKPNIKERTTFTGDDSLDDYEINGKFYPGQVPSKVTDAKISSMIRFTAYSRRGKKVSEPSSSSNDVANGIDYIDSATKGQNSFEKLRERNDEKFRPGMYIEAQFHGGVTVDDIDAIIYYTKAGIKSSVPPKVIEWGKKNGVKVYVQKWSNEDGYFKDRFEEVK